MMKTTTTDPSQSRPAGGLIEVARSFHPQDAQLAVAVLNGAGIPAEAFDLHSIIMMPNRSVALGGNRIMVPADRADEAMALLAGIPQTSPTRRPLIKVILIALVYWCGAPPLPGGLYVRRPDSVAAGV